MKPAGLGLVGAGEFAEFCFEGYRQFLPNCHLVAVYDQDRAKAASFAARFGGRAVSSFEELCSHSQISVVVILTRPIDHFSMAKQALLAGKNVLVEKPIATSLKLAEELIMLAKSQKRQLASNLVLRWHPFHQELSEDIRRKTYGALQQIMTSALLAEYPPGHWYWDRAQSGGFFLNTFTHFFDLYSFIAHSRPTGWLTSPNAKSGQAIIAKFPFGQASLSVNLHQTNALEMVRTTYIAETATIETEGWFPTSATVRHRDGRVLAWKLAGDRNAAYQAALSKILSELIERIQSPSVPALISHQTLLETVTDAIGAERSAGDT